MGLWPLHQAFGLKRYFVVDLPVGVRQRRGWGGGAGNQIQSYAKGSPVRRALCVPDRLQRHPPGRLVRRQRLHRRGDEDDAGEPQDHGAAAASGLCDLRAGAGGAGAFVAINAEFERPVSVEDARAASPPSPEPHWSTIPPSRSIRRPLDFSGKVNAASAASASIPRSTTDFRSG